jgi:predicted nucleic acid-binding Zn ribbon protein
MRRAGEFAPARACATDTMAALLARQPLSRAKVAFAWQIAVGPALARATAVNREGTALRVRAADARWSREVERSRQIILARLAALLGDGVIQELRVCVTQ